MNNKIFRSFALCLWIKNLWSNFVINIIILVFFWGYLNVDNPYDQNFEILYYIVSLWPSLIFYIILLMHV